MKKIEPGYLSQYRD